MPIKQFKETPTFAETARLQREARVKAYVDELTLSQWLEIFQAVAMKRQQKATTPVVQPAPVRQIQPRKEVRVPVSIDALVRAGGNATLAVESEEEIDPVEEIPELTVSSRGVRQSSPVAGSDDENATIEEPDVFDLAAQADEEAEVEEMVEA
jgi:hypothetical protein